MRCTRPSLVRTAPSLRCAYYNIIYYNIRLPRFGVCFWLVWYSVVYYGSYLVGFPYLPFRALAVSRRHQFRDLATSGRHSLIYYTILYYTILYYTTLYYTILHYTTLYYTILYYTILYYTILYVPTRSLAPPTPRDFLLPSARAAVTSRFAPGGAADTSPGGAADTSYFTLVLGLYALHPNSAWATSSGSAPGRGNIARTTMRPA